MAYRCPVACSERSRPDIFCWTLAGRTSRSALCRYPHKADRGLHLTGAAQVSALPAEGAPAGPSMGLTCGFCNISRRSTPVKWRPPKADYAESGVMRTRRWMPWHAGGPGLARCELSGTATKCKCTTSLELAPPALASPVGETHGEDATQVPLIPELAAIGSRDTSGQDDLVEQLAGAAGDLVTDRTEVAVWPPLGIASSTI